MAAPQSLSKQDILAQLKKEGVEDLEGLVDYAIKKTHQDGDPNKPVANSTFIFNHGVATH